MRELNVDHLLQIFRELRQPLWDKATPRVEPVIMAQFEALGLTAYITHSLRQMLSPAFHPWKAE